VGIGFVFLRWPAGTRDSGERSKALRVEFEGTSPVAPLVLMTTRPERFRVKAAKCYVAAQKAKDPETRDAYLELMRNWRELADEIEHFEHAWLDREGI
jgi:hypothetical protein